MSADATMTPPSAAAATQVIELARYTTRREDEAAYLACQPAAIRALQVAFPALASVMTVKLATTDERTTWVDVAVWTSESEALRAATECTGVPEFAACLRYVENLLSVEHGREMARY